MLKDRMGEDFWLYSITLEPDHDTPEVLAEYARNAGAGPGWTFLTGTPRDIMALRVALGFYDVDEPWLEDNNANHLGFLMMGNEPHGWWGTVPSTAAPRQIVQLIDWLKPGSKGLR